MLDFFLPNSSTILDSPVTEQEFLEQLHELSNKINFAKELCFRETLACSDIQDIVDRLKLKVTLWEMGGSLFLPGFIFRIYLELGAEFRLVENCRLTATEV